MNWTTGISNCIEDEGKRSYLKNIPLVLVSAIEYEPDAFDWLDWVKCNSN